MSYEGSYDSGRGGVTDWPLVVAFDHLGLSGALHQISHRLPFSSFAKLCATSFPCILAPPTIEQS